MLGHTRWRGMAVVCALLALGCAGCDEPETVTGAGSTGAGASSGGNQTIVCGDVTCGHNEYCGFEPGSCEGPKSCQPFPPCAPEKIACGCDKQNHQSACYADFESGGVIGEGSCESIFGIPETHFECSYMGGPAAICEIGVEYCHIEETPEGFKPSCLPVPSACGPTPTSCDCTGDPCASQYCVVDDETYAMTTLCGLP